MDAADMPRAKRPDARMVNVQIEDALMDQIEDFRYELRIPSRVQAIKTLIRQSLATRTGPSATAKRAKGTPAK